MISKKIAATLGTGTLGAGGAAGAAAWKLGLLGNKTLERVEDSRAPKVPFAGSSDADMKVVNSGSEMTWEFTALGGKGTIRVEAKEQERVVWQCDLKGIKVGGFGNEDHSEITKQKEELKAALESNHRNREKFIKNCSMGRIAGESSDRSVIELEVVKDSSSNKKLKFKNFEKLWTVYVRGINRISRVDEWLLDDQIDKDDWKVEWEEKKVTISIETKNKSENKKKKWTCAISGSISGSLNSGGFRENKLKAVLGSGKEEEKKRYLIKNCAKNNKNIMGLTIQNVENNKWKFDDVSLKKITENIYTNPESE